MFENSLAEYARSWAERTLSPWRSRLWLIVLPSLALLLIGLGCGILDPTPRLVSTPAWSTPTAFPLPTATMVPTPSPSPTAAVVPTPPDPVERGAIMPGEVVRGALPVFGVDVWTFDAGAGQYVTIGMNAADPIALDTYLELYDAGGVLVAEDDDSGGDTNSLIVEFPVAVTETLTIRALTYSGSGDYTLKVDIVVPSGGGTLWYTSTVEGVLLASWSRHTWTFAGEEGQVVSIAMGAADDVLDCYVELYGPEDVFLTDDDDSGVGYNALIEYYTLPFTGTYSVVTRGGEFGATGSYTLAVELTEMVVQGTLAYSDTVSAILKPNTRHHWLFDGEAGDVVDIWMGGEMDAYLELFAPDGIRVAVDDDGGGGSSAAIIRFELPLSGTYRIIARGHDDHDVGKYELTLVGP